MEEQEWWTCQQSLGGSVKTCPSALGLWGRFLRTHPRSAGRFITALLKLQDGLPCKPPYTGLWTSGQVLLQLKECWPCQPFYKGLWIRGRVFLQLHEGMLNLHTSLHRFMNQWPSLPANPRKWPSGEVFKGLWRLVQLIRQQKFQTDEFSLFLCQQLAFLSEKLIL